MARITITPQQVHEVSSAFEQKSRESEAMMLELDELIKSLQDGWEDVTQTRIYSDYQYWRSQMQQSTQLLDGIAQQLLNISHSFYTDPYP